MQNPFAAPSHFKLPMKRTRQTIMPGQEVKRGRQKLDPMQLFEKAGYSFVDMRKAAKAQETAPMSSLAMTRQPSAIDMSTPHLTPLKILQENVFQAAMRRGNASKIAALENDIAQIDTLMPRIDPDCCSIKTVSGKASVQKTAKK